MHDATWDRPPLPPTIQELTTEIIRNSQPEWTPPPDPRRPKSTF